MKKFAWLIWGVLLVAGVSAQGQALSPRLDSLLVYFNRQLGLPWPGDANGIASQAYEQFALNRAIIKTSVVFRCIEKQDTIYAPTSYALNSDFDSLRIVYRMVGGVKIPLEDTALLLMYKARGGVQGAISDPTNPELPRYAYTIGKTLLFYPAHQVVAGQVDTFVVEYYAVAPQLTSLSDTTIIPQKYLEAVLNFATAIVERARGNFQTADLYDAAAMGAAISTKKEEDRK